MKVTPEMRDRAYDAANDYLDPLDEHAKRAIDAVLHVTLQKLPEPEVQEKRILVLEEALKFAHAEMLKAARELTEVNATIKALKKQV